MINLLSDSKKSEIRAARANTILVRYITVLVLALAFMVGVFLFSYQSLKSLDESAQRQLSSSTPTSGSQQQADPSLLQRIYSQISSSAQVTPVLTTLSSVMPENTVMQKVSLTTESLRGSPLSLTFYAKANVQREDIEQSLKRAPIFSTVSAQEGTNSNDVSGYPKKFTVNVTIVPTERSPL